ncbi:MAG: UDP-glucose 4-epimerase GalE, partial [Propionibacterium sp.]|nr:UDP-glucose 4-epimerase GalE [Propionibacterium sp.]
VFNIGTGNGVTVKELAASFEEISGDPLAVQFGPPRPGDVAGVYTVSGKAKEVLGWEAQLTETDAVRDAIAWVPQRKEILGY